jgi:hypothetical protein
MKWIKRGLIFRPERKYDWMMSHAQVPLAEKVDHNVLRIYFGTRDRFNRTVTTFIEVQIDNPSNVLYTHDRPVLGLGELGCFDDSGAMPSCIVKVDRLKYLYYTGWNIGTTVPYRNSIGLAISQDDGLTFSRPYLGPILDRTFLEPHFCATPFVLVENGRWRMWYLSCIKWEIYKNKPEPFYHIKYAESTDAIHWERRGIVCIDFNSPREAGIVRPSIIREDGVYRMWYSYRGHGDYRTNKTDTYRIGYAESQDGIKWARKDEIVGIDVSEAGWDSEMVCYGYVYEHDGRKYMIYNGNGFGKSGFGYAILEEE